MSQATSEKYFGMSPLPYEEKQKTIVDEYTPKIDRIGIPTCVAHIFLMLLPGIVLAVVYKAWPGWGLIMNAVVPIWIATAVIYVIEPIQYYLALGTAGTYMSFLAGNISNNRLPTAVATADAMGVEPGSPEGEVVSCIAIATSQWLLAALMLIAALAITAVINVLPEPIIKAFDFLVPALFGGMLINIGLSNWRYLIVAVVLGLALHFIGVPATWLTLIMVVFMIFLCIILYKNGIWVPKGEIKSAATEDD